MKTDVGFTKSKACALALQLDPGRNHGLPKAYPAVTPATR